MIGMMNRYVWVGIALVAIGVLLVIHYDSQSTPGWNIHTNGLNATNRSLGRGPISPAEYQKMMGIGIDVDWQNYKGLNFYRIAKDFRERGFNLVRIRVKDYNYSANYLDHLQEIVDASLEAGLIPVIAFNAEEFKQNPNNQTLKDTVKMWKLISHKFKGYPYTLSYDLIIEPSQGLDKKPNMLNEFYSKAISQIREIDKYRIIFIAPNHFSSPDYLGILKIPNDKYLMVEWHFYAAGPSKTNPSKKWTTGTPEEKRLITEKIDEALKWQNKTGVLTWVGAWMPGNYNHGDDYTIPEQVSFARFMSCQLRKAGIPFAINAGKQFYNYTNYSWISYRAPVLNVILKPCSRNT